MPSPSTFGTQLIGQTEKALNAILDQQLAGTGLTEPQWVTLTIAVMSGGTIAPDQLQSRVVGALHISDSCAPEGAYPERMKMFVRRSRQSWSSAAIWSAVLVDVGSAWCHRAWLSVGRESLGHPGLWP